MELRVQQLADHLHRSLAPIYLISGDEPLQIDESVMLVRSAAREKAYDERTVFHVERGFDWNQLLEASSNLSLFSEKKILELRMSGSKPGTPGANALLEYCQQIPEDVLLLIQCAKLDRSTMNTKWVKAILNHGVVIRAWPLLGDELTRWLQQRLQKEQLPGDRATAEYIASRVEGNMLAAAQEIEKMALLRLSENNDRDNPGWVANQSKYTVFDLVDTILASRREKVVKILSQLQQEAFAPNLVLWALAELVRAMLYASSQRKAKTKKVQNAFYFTKKDRLTSCSHKFSMDQLYTLLSKCARADAAIKGRASDNVWHLFTEVSLKLAR